MTLKEMRELSDEELREISLRKNRHGCATREANMAQQVRQERSGYWPGVAKETSMAATINQERGSNFTKKFK